MKQFFQKLISSSDDVSHKRIISVVSFCILIIMVVAVFFGAKVHDTLIYVFAALTGGQSVLTVMEKLGKKDERN